MQGPSLWRQTVEQLTALHERCKRDGIATVIGVVSGLPLDSTRTSIDEFRAIVQRDLGHKQQFIVSLSTVPTEAEVRCYRAVPCTVERSCS